MTTVANHLLNFTINGLRLGLPATLIYSTAHQSLDIPQTLKLTGFYIAFAIPLYTVRKHLITKLIQKITIPEFLALYKHNDFVLNNSYFNKRALLVNFLGKNILGEFVEFLVLKRYSEKFVVGEGVEADYGGLVRFLGHVGLIDVLRSMGAGYM